MYRYIKILENYLDLNLSNLQKELNSSLTNNKCIYIEYIQENLNLIFVFENSNIENVNFDNLLLNHFSQNLVYKINDSTSSPERIDYDVLGFNKKRTITKGELRAVEYYRNYTPSSNTYSDLVVSEFREYFRNAYGLATHRVQTSHWILNDDTTGLTKTFIKYYSQTESIQEGIDRRTNIIDEAKVCVLNIIGQAYGFDFLTGVKSYIELYKDGYRPPLIDAISASTKNYMGTKQLNGLTATTIVDSQASQTNSISINSIDFSFVSSNAPTKSEIANGLVSLITGTTATSVSNYVTARVSVSNNEAIEIESKIPGWDFTLVNNSSNLSTSLIRANNNTLKQAIVDILTF